MKVLHIINDYWWSKLYSHLITELDGNVSQTIYIPIRNKNDIGKNKVDQLKNTRFVYSFIITSIFDRIFFFRKIRKIEKDIESKIDLTDFDIIHSHTLFSDGGVAYRLSKKYNVPYITTVRNTDVNVFFKYLLHTHSFGKRVLKTASGIIFLSPSYQKKLTHSILPKKMVELIDHKCRIIPNGVDKKWLANRPENPSTIHTPCKLFFVGQFTENKNLHGLIKATSILISKGIPIEVHAIGKRSDTDAKYLDNYKELISLPFVYTYEAIQDFTLLVNQIREYDILVVPSFHETFGLVYVEALTQNKPVIYTAGEGFDEQFPNGKVGYAINADNSTEIAEHIQKVISNYSSFQDRITQTDLSLYDWNRIAKRFLSIYSEICTSDHVR